MSYTFTIEQSSLQSLLSSMQPICSKRTALDVTESILFQVSPRELILKATDLEISLQSSAPIESTLTETIKFLVSGKRIFDIVKELEGPIEFVISDQFIKLNAAQGIGLSLMIKDAQDFPPFPERIENLMHLEASFLLSLLAKVAFLIPQNNANPALNGMLLECSDKEFAMVATDGHCLVRVNSTRYTLPENHKWLLPKRAVLELKKILEVNESTHVFLGTCAGQLVFSGTNFNFFTRLIAEAFPNYEPILNRDGFKAASVAREPLVKTLKRANCLLAGQFVSAAFNFGAERLNVRLDNKEVGSLEEALPLAHYEGDKVESRFYPPYVLNGLQAFDEKEIQFHIKNSTRPVIFEADHDNYQLTYLVMPVSAASAGK